MKEGFKVGQLVEIHTDEGCYTKEGFMLCKDDIESKIGLWEKIDTGSFPGYKDYLGELFYFDEGTKCVIVSGPERPANILTTDTWCRYDVYKIYICERVVSCFSHNLRALTRTKNGHR